MSRRSWVVAALCVSSALWRLGHPLWEIDDARYAAVPAEMAAAGDWVTPRLNGMNYVEKPPLGYWLGAASYRIFGVGEAAARLPLALLAMAGCLLIGWLGSWVFSLETGLAAAAMLASCALYFFHSHYITPDMALTASLLAAMALAWRAVERPRDAWWAAPAAWGAAGLAFLAKGLVGIVFPVGWACLCWLLLPGMRPGLKRLLHFSGPAAFVAVAGPWVWMMERRNPGFARFFFVEQQFQRYLTLKYNRWQPWYFFLPVLAAGLLPWTWHAASGVKKAVKEAKQGDHRAAALAVWSGMVLAFFSASNSKLVSYILPAFPQLCLLGAHALREKARWSRAAVWTMALWALALWGGGSLADERLSARTIGRAIADKAGPGDLVYTYDTYVHGLPFYSGRRVDKAVNWVGELHYAKRDPRNKDRFGDDADIMALPLPDRSVFVVVNGKQADYFLTVPGGRPATYLQYGKWMLAEFKPAVSLRP